MELAIQLQPARSPGYDIRNCVVRLSGLAHGATITEGFDVGPYVNIYFDTSDVTELWSRLRHELEQDTSLANCSIICCQGDAGWDDYRLLHHYDPAEAVDESP